MTDNTFIKHLIGFASFQRNIETVPAGREDNITTITAKRTASISIIFASNLEAAVGFSLDETQLRTMVEGSFSLQNLCQQTSMIHDDHRVYCSTKTMPKANLVN